MKALHLLAAILAGGSLGQELSHSRHLLNVLSYEKQHAIQEPPSESWIRQEVVTTPQSSQQDSRKSIGANLVSRGEGGVGGGGKWNASKARHHGGKVPTNDVLLFVHIAKTGGSSFDEILKGGVNNVEADCIVEKKHYEDRAVPLTSRYDFPRCKLISTEFSRFQASKFLVPKARKGGPPPPTTASALQLPHVKYLTILREPFARLLSQFRHDKYYTPRRFKGCPDLASLVEQGVTCIEKSEPAYRYQNFQSMMLGGCVWNHKLNLCEPTRHPSANGGGFVSPVDVLDQFFFVGLNEHFEASVCLFYDSLLDKKHFTSFCKGSKPAVPHVMQGSWITKKESTSGGGGRTALDAAVLRSAVRTNELDFKLYWAASDGFKNKLLALEQRTGLSLL